MPQAMSRIARASAVSPKVYRHFAVVTIAITACIGLFADGESTEALRSQIEAREARNRLLTAEADKLGARRLKAGNLRLRNEKRAYIAFAPDEGSDVRNNDGAENFHSGAVTVVANRQDRPPAPDGDALQAVPPVLAPGISPSDNAARGQVRRQAQRPRAASGPSAAQVEAMIAASKARSGNQPEE